MNENNKVVYIEPKQLDCGHKDTLAHELVGRVMTAYMLGQSMGVDSHTILTGMEMIVERTFLELGISNNHVPAIWRKDAEEKPTTFRVPGNETIN